MALSDDRGDQRLTPPLPTAGSGGLRRVLAACAVLLCVAVILLGHTGRDDSHITYFVSQSLADGQGLVNYNGARVEQSSTLSWTLVLAAAAAVTGIGVATLGPVLSFLFLLLSVGVVAALTRRAGLSPLAPLGLASLPIVYWSLSGMENSFYLFLCLLLGLAVLLDAQGSAPPPADARRSGGGGPIARAGVVAALSALLALTRPEYLPVVALAAVLLTLSGGRAWRARARLAALLLGGAGVAVGLRLLAGLDLFPNTVYAKAAGPPLAANIRAGIDYLILTGRTVPLSAGMAVAGFVAGLVHLWRLGPSPAGAVLALFLALSAAIGAFAVASGGDWMEAGRFVAVPMALATLAGLAAVPRRWAAVAGTLVVAALLADTWRLAAREFGGLPYFARHPYEVQAYAPSPLEAYNVVHARDLTFIDRALPVLDRAAGRDGEVVVASIQAGMVPFYVARELGDRFHFVDLKGLSTRHIHDCRGEDGWLHAPYRDIRGLQACIGIEFDFVFDLDFPGWPRLEDLRETGCREVFREQVTVDAGPDWKPPVPWYQFLADCR